MSKNAKTVLVVAYACEPNKTSEPGVGWNFTKEIAQSFNTVVLTRKNNREQIEMGEGNKATFIYYDLPKIFRVLKKRIPLGTQWYYALWQWGGYRYAKNYFSDSKQLDLVHHLNFAATWLTPPAYLIKRPFVWGPIGGGDYIPFEFFGSLDTKAKLQELIYYITNQLGRFSIFALMTRKKANAVLFRTESAKNRFPQAAQKLLATVSETASNMANEKIDNKENSFIRAMCVGRMNYWKGFLYAVVGFHKFLDSGGEGVLELFGEGPETAKIKAYISKHQLADHILVHGFVNNAEIKKKMKAANVLLHPSFREGGSWSIMEAMSFGLPVICLNTSGPKDMVTEKCGILIDLTSSDEIEDAIGQALLKLHQDEDFFATLSTNAVSRIKNEYTWEKRRTQIKAVYEQVWDNTFDQEQV